MIVSTKGRYALRVIIDLAENNSDKYIPMKDIAQRQGISLNYIARIIPIMSKKGLVEGVVGKGGGYRLKQPPESITVGEILRLTEESLAPVSCLECNAKPCKLSAECRTLPMWKEAYKILDDYFNSVSILDLMKK